VPWLRRLVTGVSPGRPCQPICYLWWTKWHRNRFFSEFFGFPLPIYSRRDSSYSYTYHLGDDTIGPLVAAVQRHCRHEQSFLIYDYVSTYLMSETTQQIWVKFVIGIYSSGVQSMFVYDSPDESKLYPRL
jgi:hypothetical protein